MPRRRDYSTPLPFPYVRTLSGAQELEGNTYPRLPLNDREHIEATVSRGFQPVATAADKRDGHTPRRKQANISQSTVSARRAKQWASPDSTVHTVMLKSEPSSMALKTSSFIITSMPTRSDPNDSRMTEQINRNSRMHPMKQKRSLEYERVEGVLLHARRRSSPDMNGYEETIPEIEARDVRRLPQRAPALHSGRKLGTNDNRGITQLPSPSGSGKHSLPSAYWSDSSDGSSSISTRNTSPEHNDHVSPTTSSEVLSTGNIQAEPVTATLSGSRKEVTRSGCHLSRNGGGEGAGFSGPGTTKLDLGVILEEDGEYDQGAAPPPATPELQMVDNHEHKDTSSSSSASSHDAVGLAGYTGPSQNNSPPKVLGAPGVGDDRHIYIYDQVSSASIQESGSSSNGIAQSHGKVGVSSAPSASPGMLGTIQSGVSRAGRTVHDRVRKNITLRTAQK